MRKLFFFLFLLPGFLHAEPNPAQELLFHPEKLEERIRTALAHYIESAEKLEAEFIQPEKSRLLLGEFEKITIRFQRARIKKVVLDEGEFILFKPRIQLNDLYSEGKLRISTMQASDFYLKIQQVHMNQALQEKKLPLENPELRFLDGHMEFKARFRTLFIKQLVETKGNFEVKDQHEIHFIPFRLKLNHIPLPGFVKNTIRNKINPVLDLKNFPLAGEVESITIHPGILEIRG